MKKKKDIKIKYDKKSVKILGTASVIAMAVFATGLVLSRANIDGLELLVFLSLFMGGGLMIVCPIMYLGGLCYFRRLKAYGYIVPNKKMEYDCLLKNVPREMDVNEKSIYSKDSKLCARISFGIYLFLVCLDSTYYWKWKFVGDIGREMLIIEMVFCLFWLILAFVIWRQSNKEQYKDDVEVDQVRKTRWSLEECLFTIVFFLIIGIFGTASAVMFTEYIFKTHIAEARQIVNDVCNATADVILNENTSSDLIDNKQNRYEELCNGVVVTDWQEPKDELQQKIAANMAIDNFEELKNHLHVTSGEPQLVVQIVDNKVVVWIDNPMPEVASYCNGQELSAETNLDGLAE